jgi:hypothetical protein
MPDNEIKNKLFKYSNAKLQKIIDAVDDNFYSPETIEVAKTMLKERMEKGIDIKQKKEPVTMGYRFYLGFAIFALLAFIAAFMIIDNFLGGFLRYSFGSFFFNLD